MTPPYTASQVIRLVPGLTYRRLEYWTRTGLTVPSVRMCHGHGRHRLYSARDVIAVRLVALLMRDSETYAYLRPGRRPFLEEAVRLIRGVPPEALADQYLVAVHGLDPVVLSLAEFAERYEAECRLGGSRWIKVVPLGPLVEDAVEAAA